MSMTVAELAEELRGYLDMGMGAELVYVSVRGQYAEPNRTEPGDGIKNVYILDEGTV